MESLTGHFSNLLDMLTLTNSKINSFYCISPKIWGLDKTVNVFSEKNDLLVEWHKGLKKVVTIVDFVVMLELSQKGWWLTFL